MADKPLLGGDQILDSNPTMGRGVYAPAPASTPKYHTGNGVESMARQARFYIEVADGPTYQRYRKQTPERARRFLDVLSPQSERGGVGYFDFLLSNISSPYQEKFQVSEVLTDGYIAFFYGQKAPMWSMTGFLMNTEQDQWYDSFHILYQDVMRGTQLARAQVPLKLAYDNRIITGAMVSSTTSMTGAQETAIQFQIQFLVKRVYIRRPEDIAVTDPSSVLTGGEAHFDVDMSVFTTLFDSLEEAKEEETDPEKLMSHVRPGADTDALQSRLEDNDTFEGGFTPAPQFSGG